LGLHHSLQTRDKCTIKESKIKKNLYQFLPEFSTTPAYI